ALLAGQAPVSRVAALGACPRAVQKTVGEKWRAGRNKDANVHVIEIPIQIHGTLDEGLAPANAVATKAGSRRRHGGGVRPPPASSQPDEPVGAHLPGAAGHREKAEQHGCREATVTLVKPMATSCEVRRVDGRHGSRKLCTRARSKSKAFELAGTR